MHRIMSTMKQLPMLLLKTMEMGAIENAVPLITHGTSGVTCASAQTPGHTGLPKSALLNWQGMTLSYTLCKPVHEANDVGPPGAQP